MTKKIIVIALAFVLCLSVIGGCFALYAKNAEELNISFGSEQAVSLTLSRGSVTFGNVAISPADRTRTQDIVLNVSAPKKEDLAGMSGRFTVALEGGAVDYVTLSATSKNSDNTAGPNYTQAQLTAGQTLPLDALPKYVSLTLSLNESVTDAQFKGLSDAGAYVKVTVSWEVVDWTPEEGAYYIVGTHSAWGVNEKAIKMNAPANPDAENANLAEWYGTIPAGTEFKCVQYNAGNITWYDLEFEPNYGPAKIDKYGDGEGGVTAKNGNMCAPAEEIFVCVNTDGADNTKHYSWGQTTASMAAPAE